MPSKELAFSLRANDFEWAYSRPGGHGGQKMQKTSSRVQVRHSESGAMGQASDTRSQLQNRRIALQRLIDSAAFKIWLNRKLMQGPTPEQRVEKDMDPRNLKVENQENGVWVDAKTI